MNAFNTLNTAMEQLKADREKDLEVSKRAAKIDLMEKKLILKICILKA